MRDYTREVSTGAITGAADTDPTTVGTMVVIGASTGYVLSWLVWLMFPALSLVQALAGRLGTVTGQDLQSCVRDRFGRLSLWAVLLSVLLVSVITASADLQAGGSALGLLVHAEGKWLVLPLSLLCAGVLVTGRYDEVQRVLKVLVMALLAFVAAAILAHPNWGQVARRHRPCHRARLRR